MIKDPTLLNVETAYGIVDVYPDNEYINDGETTSFIMSNPNTCNMKQRVHRLIAVEFDIEV